MKKISLLFATIFLFLGMAQAQDIYFAGNSNGTAKVWKNNILIYSISDTVQVSLSAMKIAPNGAIYTAGYSHDSTYDFVQGRVWLNDSLLFNAGTNTVINSLVVNDSAWIAAGVGENEWDDLAGLVWQNGEVLYAFSDSTCSNQIKALAIDPSTGDIYSGGTSSEFESMATIWKNDTLLWRMDSVSAINDIVFAGTSLYAAGCQYFSNTSSALATLWQNDSIIFTFGEENSEFTAIAFYDGSIYLGGYNNDTLYIWQDGEILYSHPCSLESKITALLVNEFGVYYAGQLDSVGTIWKNGEILCQPEDCDLVNGLALLPSETPLPNPETSVLPWFDGFEVDSTWNNWTIFDFDGCHNIGWQRNDEHTATGSFSAYHQASEFIQEGWLITPPLYLQPNRDSTLLTFNTLEINPENYAYSGLLISTTGREISDFTEIWTQENPSEEWNAITLDLSEYQGERIFLAFKYNGDHGHDWYIDDVTIEEFFTLRDTITAFPYTEDFENGLGDWYILDEDHSGQQNNWKVFDGGFESDHCFGHVHDSLSQQTSWAISRPLHLQHGRNYTLYYWFTANGLSERDNSGVWIADSINGVPTLDDFTQIFKNEDNTGDSWKRNNINLNSYLGHDIYFALGYDGYDHDWMIDSLYIEETMTPYTITAESDHPAWGYVIGGGTYYYLDTVQLEAHANLGFEFLGWDDGNTDNPRTIVVTESQSFIAHFGIQQCMITTEVTPEGAGSVNGGGTFDYGTIIQLVAHSNPGYVFTQWSDGVIVNPRTVFVEGDATYTAEFELRQCIIATIVTPEDGGIITGGGTYNYGDTVTLTAIPNPYFEFICWSDGIVTNPRIVVATHDVTYNAIFHSNGVPEYTITVLANDSSLGTVTGSGTYPEGATIEISATPFDDAIFVGWDDGNTDNPRSVTVLEDATYTAVFKINEIQTFNIRVETDNPFMGSVYGSGTYPANTVISIGAIPSLNCHFTGWQDGDMSNPRTITVTEDAVYIASFEKNPAQHYSVVLYYDENQGFVIGSGDYVAGSTATLAAIPTDGYVFRKWSDDNTENPRQVIVDHDIVLTVIFEYTSVDENDVSSIQLYPNPANEKIKIDGLEGSHEIGVFNAFGVQIMTIDVNGDEEIDVSSLPSGFYFILIDGGCPIRWIKN